MGVTVLGRFIYLGRMNRSYQLYIPSRKKFDIASRKDLVRTRLTDSGFYFDSSVYIECNGSDNLTVITSSDCIVATGIEFPRS